MTNKDFKKSDYIQTLDWLMTYFPNAFSNKPKEVKPLKIGILEDIYVFYDTLKFPQVNKQSIKQAIQHYSASTIYLSCQKEDQARIDLYGQEVGVVNKEQAKYAHERYEQKIAMRQAKREEPEA